MSVSRARAIFLFGFSSFLQWSRVPISLDDFEIAQYDLVTWRPYTKLGRIGEGRNRSNKSVVAIDFTFQRQTGFFLLQVRLLRSLNKIEIAFST